LIVRTALPVSLLLALSLFSAAAAPAKRPPPPPPSDRGAPTTPTNLRITASTDTSVSLAWDASTDNSANWWYCVQSSGAGCFRVDPPQTTFTHPKLLPNTTYSFSVVAIDAAGNRSGSSNTVTYTTPPDVTPPSPAPELTATAVYPIRISLNWTDSKDNVSQVYYTLFKDGSPYFAGQIGYRSWTVLDLSPSTTYEFVVEARDYSGNAVRSNVLSVTTPAATDTTPPAAPTNLRLSPESSAPEIWLDWDQSTDDTDPQSQIMYDVYQNGVFGEHAAIGYGETITYCAGTGPTTVTVRAVDTSGNASAPSNEIVFDC
jgi:chitodextrinase